MTDTDAWVAAILPQVIETFEPWMSCDECFERSDLIVDALLDGEPAAPAEFRAHLAGCSACRDEVAALAALAAHDRGLDVSADEPIGPFLVS